MNKFIACSYHDATFETKPTPEDAKTLTHFKSGIFTIDELGNMITRGQTIVPCIMKANAKKESSSFQNISLIFFDIDGTQRTINEFIDEVFNKFQAKPVFYYESFSHQEERKGFSNCYRVAYELSRTINDLEEFRVYYKSVIRDLGAEEDDKGGVFKLDRALQNPTQMLYGTNKAFHNLEATSEPFKVGEKEVIFENEHKREVSEYENAYGTNEISTNNLKYLLTFVGDLMLSSSYDTWYPLVFATARYCDNQDTFLEVIEPYLDNQRSTKRTVLKIFADSKRERNHKTTLGTLIYHAKKNGFDGFDVDFNKLVPQGTKLGKDEYLSEENVLDIVRPTKKSLLISSAGTGKTKSTVEATYRLIKEKSFRRVVFMFPTTILVKQAYYEACKLLKSDTLLAYQRGNGDVYHWNKGQKKILFCTYDMITNITLNDDDLIVIDEVHLLNDYSNFKATITKRLKKLIASDSKHTVLALTATPQATPLSAFDIVSTFQKDSNKKAYIVQASEKRKSQLKAIEKLVLRKRGKKLIYINSKVKAEKLKDDLSQIFPTLKINTVHADNKNKNDDFNAIVENTTLVSDIVIATKLINVGVNIKNTVSDIIAINLYDFTEIMQLINRERSEADFTLFYTPKTRKASNHQLQVIINKDEKTKEEVSKLLNAYATSFQPHESVIADSLTNNVVTSELETFFGTKAEGIEDVLTLRARISFDSWQDRYNDLQKLYKMLEPNDVYNFLIANEVNVSDVNNFEYEEVIEDETEEEIEHEIFTFKSVKDVYEQYEAEDLKNIRNDLHAWSECQQYIHEVIEKNKIRFVRDFIFDNHENFDFMREQGITSEAKYDNFMLAKEVIEANNEKHEIFAPLVRALNSEDKVLRLTEDEITRICYLANSDETSEKKAISILKKYRKISSKQIWNGEKRGSRVNIVF